MSEAEVTDPAALARFASLARLGLLDTPAEAEFDDIALLATQVCLAPVALVSFVAENRQWFKARVGFPASQTDLDHSVCRHTVREDTMLVIPDLRLDARTRANPLVTESPLIRFYAGVPLRDGAGTAIGSLCVIDTRTRPSGLTPSQEVGLHALARHAARLLELRRPPTDA